MNQDKKHLIAPLLVRLLENDLTDSEIEILNRWLENDPDAIRHYCETLKNYAIVQKEIAGAYDLSGNADDSFFDKIFLNELVNLEKKAPAVEIPESRPRPKPAPKKKLVQPSPPNKFNSYAAVISAAVLMFTLLYVHLFPEHPGRKVVTLMETLNAEWAAGPIMMHQGMRLMTSDPPFHLKKGYAELRFDNQARITIEGPATFQIIAEKELRLQFGKLYAYIPEEAIGFVVQTDKSAIVDYGTEFGVIADKTGKTEVQVFRGEVDFRTGSDAVHFSDSRRLRDGQAGLIDEEGKLVAGKTVSSGQFVSEIRDGLTVIRHLDGTALYATDSTSLVHAVNNGTADDAIFIGPGVFELTAPLKPKTGMTIRGSGRGVTVLTAADSWNPGIDGLPEHGLNPDSVNRQAYLFSLDNQTERITLSDMTLRGPRLHGALFGDHCDFLELHNLSIEDFLWSSIRTFSMSDAKFHDNVFINAGGNFDGKTGGAVYMTWVKNSEFWNNRIYKTDGKNFYGFKCRQAKYCRFHHNTVQVSYSFEFRYEVDEGNEIDHNVCDGEISLLKPNGGPVFNNGHSFHIHHNLLRNHCAVEGPRNSLKINHNLFDLKTTNDNKNLIYSLEYATVSGPCEFHDNLVKNPGRGLFGSHSGYNNITFRNNHIIANPTVTPRSGGLFGLSASATDFSTIVIRDNIIECIGTQRPLMRDSKGYAATIENNTLINLSDAGSIANPDTGAPRGPTEPLRFSCGAYNEYDVNGWQVREKAYVGSRGK